MEPDHARPLGGPVSSLLEERRVLVLYLTSKTAAEDWHAVADAAMDLRELDAKLSILQSRKHG